jgi:hypothetical protein
MWWFGKVSLEEKEVADTRGNPLIFKFKYNNESENKEMDQMAWDALEIQGTEEELDTDYFMFTRKYGDLNVNISLNNVDADIFELGDAIKYFILACGYTENTMNQIMQEW